MTRESSFRPVGSARPNTAATRPRLADASFLGRLALLYIALSLLVVLTLDRFWSANWDVEIILQATRSLWDGGSPFDLYEVSRASWPWPFPYPPHAALLLAPFIALTDWLVGTPTSGWPQLIAIRTPVFVADVAIAWLLHRIVRQATGERWLARLAALLWLFNPILFYHTAVQAHQETTWLLPALGAYLWLQERGRERLWLPIALMVLAIGLKQSAVIYAAPMALLFLLERRWRAVAGFALLFLLFFGGISLPWHLYSGDFRALVFDEVRQMPVQVQSWQVWTLALPDFLIDQTRTTFPTVRYAALLTLVAATGLGTLALRRGRSWYAVGLIATLAFLLLSQKVMAYHYPMLLPWLIAFAFRSRALGVAALGLLWTSWILVSPYFAPWADAAHLPYYALLGTLNSLFFLWLLWQALTRPESGTGGEQRARPLLGLSLLLTVAFTLASVTQPLVAPLLAWVGGGGGRQLGAVGLLLLAVALITLVTTAPLTGRVAIWLGVGAGLGLTWPATVALTLLFVPLFFTWFTMTAEITAVIENGLLEAWRLPR